MENRRGMATVLRIAPQDISSYYKANWDIVEYANFLAYNVPIKQLLVPHVIRILKITFYITNNVFLLALKILI